jgi:hypothetical protein
MTDSVAPIPAGAQADRIVLAAAELCAAMSDASREQLTFGVLLSCEDLVRAYCMITDVERVFHLACEDRDRRPGRRDGATAYATVPLHTPWRRRPFIAARPQRPAGGGRRGTVTLT